jgi:hypothetical protein
MRSPGINFSKNVQWLSYIALGLWAFFCMQWHVPILIIPGLILTIALSFLTDRHHRHPQKSSELEDPFMAEVLLDGKVVATLTDRVWTEMFWRDYRISPVSEETKVIIENDELWDNCRFTFRDPATGMICDTAFVGGIKPFVHDGIVSLRAMYFTPDRRSS